MARSYVVAVLVLLSGCSTQAQRRQEALMNEIETSIHLPTGAQPFERYARYYAYDAPDEVMGVYMLPRLDDPPGEACEELSATGPSRSVPCSNAAKEGKEVGEGQRIWLSDFYNLPLAYDNKCGALTILFDAKAHRFKDVSCVGVASNVQAQPDQVGFFERPKALATALQSHTAIPLVVLLGGKPSNGSGLPTFALYDDGTVIKQTGNGFVTSKLTPSEREQFIRRLNVDALRRLYGHFEVATSTDQPSQDLLFYVAPKPVFVSVYGSLSDPLVRANTPAPIVSAYQTIAGFDLPRARKWSPGKFPHEELWTSPNTEAK